MGDRVYLSNGDFGPAPLTALDVRTGEVLWRQRVASRASLIGVGARLLILDEDGELILGTPTANELRIDARARVLERRSWTAPTLAGTVLLLRDRVSLKAYDLGKTAVP
jgi:outer membrane protein assembly factor BamB